MTTDLHLAFYWGGRRERLDASAARLWRFLEGAAGLSPRLQSFRLEAEGAPVLDGSTACLGALERGAVAWQLGEREEIAYEIELFVERSASPPVAIRLTCGLEPPPFPGVFAPNRMVLTIDGNEPDLADTRVVHGLMSEAVRAWEATFGHAGSRTRPEPAAPLYSQGVPPVGWMTFLSRAYPPPPPAWPAPTVAYPVGALGTLIVAHPDPFQDHRRVQREAVARVENILRENGILRPWSEVERTPPR